MSLRAFLYDSNYGSPNWIMDLTPYLRDINLSVEQHGGVRSLELLLDHRWSAASLFTLQRIGHRILIVNNAVEVVAEGTIMVPSLVRAGNRVSCLGPYWDLCFRQVYNDTATWVGAAVTSEVIKDMLTDECPAVSSDQSNIAATGTDAAPWQTAENAYPGDLIPRLAAMSDASHREWYFWLKSAPPVGVVPQKPIAYFQPQDLTTVDFWFSRKDCPEGGIDFSPSLLGLVNDLRIMYRDAAGSQQQTGSATDSDSQAKYWLQERWSVPIATVPQAVAEQYRGMYLARYKDPQQSFSFRLNGWVGDEDGRRQPLWEVIKQFPCNIGIRDLLPEAAILSGVDRQQVFAVAAARYSYARNELTITPDLEERTMENLLALWMGAG